MTENVNTYLFCVVGHHLLIKTIFWRPLANDFILHEFLW